MSSDGYFWAGMAGGRQNRIDKLNEDIDMWEAHTQKLERIINDLRADIRALRKSRFELFERAVYEQARAEVANNAFINAYGINVTDCLGGPDKASKQVERAKIECRKNGVGKGFNYHL